MQLKIEGKKGCTFLLRSCYFRQVISGYKKTEKNDGAKITVLVGCYFFLNYFSEVIL